MTEHASPAIDLSAWLAQLPAGAGSPLLREAVHIGEQRGGVLGAAWHAAQPQLLASLDLLRALGVDEEAQAACIVHVLRSCDPQPDAALLAALPAPVRALVEGQEAAERVWALHAAHGAATGSEGLRRLLLAIIRDLRVVFILLARQLVRMRALADAPEAERVAAARLTADMHAPLANRLGIWQLKWELEDLSLRFTRPSEYREIAQQLDESREQRIEFMQSAVLRIRGLLEENGIKAEVSGRPKHIYSIWKKMQRKHLRFDQLFDVRAVRIIVDTVERCYQVLSIVHENFPVISKEYDDYIAKPKPNGYQSLHTVVTDKAGRPLEIQIRTRAMHEFAELGVAAHWRYKEAGNSNGATSAEEQRVAWLRQLLAWGSDMQNQGQPEGEAVLDDHIYALTPQGRVVELPRGGTPVDFAYAVHTQLGHRTKGAKVDGVLVPLNTKLETGQTVEIIAAKVGQPSRDWLSAEKGFAASPRTRNKVRQWFNAQQTAELTAQGREKIDKELARLGKTAVKLEDLAKRLGYEGVDELCLAYGKEEITQTALATAVQPPKPAAPEPDEVLIRQSRNTGKSDVLVVGVDSLLTQLARCCHPVPPDEIVGYVTRGRGVTIHRADCPNIRNMSEQDHGRLIEVSWGRGGDGVFPAEVFVVATDRPGLIRDISEIFMKAKQNLVGMNSQKVKTDVRMRFTVEIPSASSLTSTLTAIRELKGVLSARRC